MKGLVIFLGAVGAFIGVVAGHASLKYVEQRNMEIARVQADVLQLKTRLADLKKLPQRPFIALMRAYEMQVNAMEVVAKAHHVNFAVSVPAEAGADVRRAALSSSWAGVQEIPLRVSFSGIARRAMLLSLLDGLVAVEDALPVRFEKLYWEKEVLTADLAVLGPQ